MSRAVEINEFVGKMIRKVKAARDANPVRNDAEVQRLQAAVNAAEKAKDYKAIAKHGDALEKRIATLGKKK